jgi:peptidoglycan hydrolase CwlO-like protein
MATIEERKLKLQADKQRLLQMLEEVQNQMREDQNKIGMFNAQIIKVNGQIELLDEMSKESLDS